MTDSFGDPKLAPSELVPTPAAHRHFAWRELGALWLGCGATPAAYAAFAWGGSLGAGVLGAMLGTLVALLLGLLLARPAWRYGLSAPPLLRAALGPRGATLGLGLRCLVACLASAYFLSELGGWAATLLAVSTGKVGLVREVPGTVGVTYLGFALSLPPLLFGLAVARGGVRRAARVAGLAGVVALVLGATLLVFAGVVSKGFGAAPRDVPFSLPAFLRLIATVAAGALPLALSSPDWERFRAPRKAGRGALFDLAAAGAALLMAATLAFVGGLLARASFAMRGRFDASAIPDAAGFGGYGAAALAAGFLLAVVLVGMPIQGGYSAALALLGGTPRPKSYGRALTVVTVLTALGVPAMGYLRAHGFLAADVGLLLAGILGVTLADDLVVRRGKVHLEDLYIYASEYGYFLGVSLAGVIALATGLLAHPWVLQSVVAGHFEVPSAAGSLYEYGGGLLVALVASAAVYSVLRPLEFLLARALRRVMQRRERRAAARGERELERMRLLDSASTQGLTDPFFTYSKKDEKKDG